MRKSLVLLSLLLAPVARPLAAQSGSPLEPLRRGILTVWIVAGPPVSTPKTPALDYARYHEQTAGSFGQDAGNVGQTSGSYGQTSGSFGTSSGNVGQTSGSYGQDVGDPIGRPAAGSPRPETASSTQMRQVVAAWSGATERLHREFPGLRLQVFTIDGAELRDRLAAYVGKVDFPDVLLGNDLMAGPQAGGLREASLAILGADRVSGRLAVNGKTMLSSTPLVLRRAPHPGEARAFLFWLEEEEEYCRECAAGRMEAAAETPAGVAVGAVGRLLDGGTLGASADPAIAQVGSELSWRIVFSGDVQGVPGGVTLQTEVRSATANDRLAVVGLRVTANSATGFGVLHPAVVLRRGTDGRWRVLQISADVRTGEPDPAVALARYTEPVAPEKVKAVTGVKLAAPLDGDTRTSMPDLWWDDPGNAGLLAVEWQTRGESAWSDTHLFFVNDRGSRLQVRVPAPFAQIASEYRWRVWSVGEGGVLALSPWRRVTVLR